MFVNSRREIKIVFEQDYSTKTNNRPYPLGEEVGGEVLYVFKTQI
jgi:hypothetical protein